MDSYMPQKLPFSKKRLSKRVIFSYILDYVIIVVLFIGIYALDAVEPYHQHFSLRNYTLQYPYTVHERVPIALLGFVAVLCPAAIIAIYALVIDGRFSRQKGGATGGGEYRMKDRLWELNCGILGLLLSSVAAFVITGALKNATGKPRPDLIARCQPKPGSDDLPVFGLSNSTICTQTNNAILKDGFRSFPSGHSSSSWAGLFYLSLYLAAKLHVLDNRGEVWKAFVVLVPVIGAALIAISRIMDARHHPFDVISGSMLGAVVAWCSYRQYFPPLSEPWKQGRAYPIRTWATEPAGPDAVAVEREVSRHQGTEPLRAPVRNDEEQYAASSGAAVPEAGSSVEGNVFRQQISQSQRRRQAQGDLAAQAPSSYSSVPEPRNPFPVRSQRGGQNDGYWSSSSEDGDEGYELRQQYTLNDPHGQGNHGGYGVGHEDFGRDTAYHSPPSVAHPQYSPAVAGTQPVQSEQDVAGIPPVRSPPPQHVGPSRESGDGRRGVNLVETYAK